MKFAYVALPLVLLTACNYITMKPGSLDKDKLIYVDRTTNLISHAIKESLEENGYRLTSGFKRARVDHTYMNPSAKATDKTPGYFLGISVHSSRTWPIWCFFNGFNHWDFDMHVVDNETGQEIFAWSGYGCQNSTLRKLEREFDKLEMKK